MKKNIYTGERFEPEKCEGEMQIEHFQRYVFATKFVKGKKVLDAACGEGYGSYLLSGDAKEVVGIDIFEEVIFNAKEKYKKNNLSFISSSIETIPMPDDYFDIIVSFETIEHVEEEVQNKFLNEISRVLKPEGILIMSTPNKAVYTDLVDYKNEFHVKEFYYNEYLNFIKRKFEFVNMYKQYPVLTYCLTGGQEICTQNVKEKNILDVRYFIAVSSNRKIEEYEYQDIQYDDTNYYILNKYIHKLEKDIKEQKIEGERFQKQLLNDINEQKIYVRKLEKDLDESKKYIQYLEEEFKHLQNYARHLENDINEVTNYARRLEKE